jgi:hypothetical protein
MAKYSDFTQGPKKKKEVNVKKKITQVMMWVLVVIIGVSFIFWVGGRNHNEGSNFPIIATIDGKAYENRPYSPFWYIYSQVQSQFQSGMYSKLFTPEQLSKFIFIQSAENLVDFVVIYDFAKKQNIQPSMDLLKAYFRYESQSKNYEPGEDFIDFIKMDYSHRGLIGTYGDVVNAAGYFSEVGLYSYLDILQYKAKIDVLFIDVTNFIANKVEVTQVSEFYLQKNYAQEITVQDILVKDKAAAPKVLNSIQSNGWDKTIAEYKDNIIVSNKFTLTKGDTTLVRFNEALNYFPGQVIPNIVFESGYYHVMKVVSIPDFKSLSKEYQQYLSKEYVKYYFPILLKKYEPLIQASITEAQALIAQKIDMKTIADKIGWEYEKSADFTALDNSIMTENKEQMIPLPIVGNDQIMDFVFMKDINSVSPLFSPSGYHLFVKVLARQMDTKQKNADELTDLMRDYFSLKNQTIIKDWVKNLRANSKIIMDKEKLKMEYLK